MRGANLSALRLAALFLFSAGLARASGPPTDQTGPPPPPRRNTEIQSLGVDPLFTTFAGTVLNVQDRPLQGTEVVLFVNGQRVASAVTGPDGTYKIKCRYDYREDATTILWYVPADHSLLPKAVVLSESTASRDNQIISPCVARAKFVPGHLFRVYLFDPVNRVKELEESNCLP